MGGEPRDARRARVLATLRETLAAVEHARLTALRQGWAAIVDQEEARILDLERRIGELEGRAPDRGPDAPPPGEE